MTNPIIRVHNLETNDIIDREMTAEELAQYEADRAAEAELLAAEKQTRLNAEQKAIADAALAEQKAAEEAERLSAKLAIYAKLGLTEEEINTLIS